MKQMASAVRTPHFPVDEDDGEVETVPEGKRHQPTFMEAVEVGRRQQLIRSRIKRNL